MSKYEQAVNKVNEELSMYKENLLLQSPEKIYSHSFESVSITVVKNPKVCYNKKW